MTYESLMIANQTITKIEEELWKRQTKAQRQARRNTVHILGQDCTKNGKTKWTQS